MPLDEQSARRAVANKKYNAANKDKRAALDKKYRETYTRPPLTDARAAAIKASRRKWYLANKETILARQRAYQAANKDKIRAYQKQWSKDTNYNERRKGYMRLKNWRVQGLPEPTRPEPKQCECCGQAERRASRSLSLDHCHQTGAFRGWLCSKCNLAIGKLGDTIEALQKAVDYLKRSKQ
jgi:hypothetical protein